MRDDDLFETNFSRDPVSARRRNRFWLYEQNVGKPPSLSAKIRSNRGWTEITGRGGSNLTSLVRDWATSTLTDDLTTTAASYQQSTWNLRSLFAAIQTNGVYPLATTALSATSPTSVNVSGGSAAYLRFSVAAGQTASIQWNTLPSNVQLTLVRTR